VNSKLNIKTLSHAADIFNADSDEEQVFYLKWPNKMLSLILLSKKSKK